jgi:aminoglycoside 2'-N-acetyltransferase I
MAEIVVAHTGQLDAATLAAARALLFEVFDDMTDDDWEHSLGGMHALAREAGEVVGHASLVQRRLLHGGRTLRAGYVEGVAVREGRRRQGIASALMGRLEDLAVRAYDVAALGATDEAVPFYVARGWRLWSGPSSALTPDGIRPTPGDDGCIYVLPLAAALDLHGEITCDWRDGDLW